MGAFAESSCGDSLALSPTLLQAVTVAPWPLSPAILQRMERAQPCLSHPFQRMHSLWCKNASHSFHTFFTGEKQRTRIPKEAWGPAKTWLSHTTLKWQSQFSGVWSSLFIVATGWCVAPKIREELSCFQLSSLCEMQQAHRSGENFLEMSSILYLRSLVVQNHYLTGCACLECRKLSEVLLVWTWFAEVNLEMLIF